MRWSRGAVSRDGVGLSYRSAGGAGRPVVLLHGLAGHGGEWDATARLLVPHFRVFAPDQRGHADSDLHPADVSPTCLVADVVHLLDRLGLQRAVLVGQSLGGLTALLTAATRPERVEALVLVESAPSGPDTAAGRAVGELPDGVARFASWFDGWPVPFPSREAAVVFFGGGGPGAGWADGLVQRDDGWWPRVDREVMLATLAAHARRSSWPDWERLRCPVLAVLGRHGMIADAAVAEMARRRPGTVSVSVPGAGHDLHLDRPEALAALVRGFLAESGTAAP